MNSLRRALTMTVYNAVAPIALLAMLPGAIRKSKRRGGYQGRFRERFAWYGASRRKNLADLPRRPWFFQAVSVGETAVATKLIEALKTEDPDLPVVLATTTPTGQALAEQRVGDLAEILYSPLDLPPVVLQCLDTVRPERIVLVDSDLWPNFIWLAKGRGIPTSIVNARLSPRSARRFAKAGLLTEPLFDLIDQVCVDNDEDLERWASLGVARQRIMVTGSPKFDTTAPANAPREFGALLAGLWPGSSQVLLGASTYEGEELLLAQTWRQLRPTHPDLRLAIAPRHVERSEEIIAELEPAGFSVERRSDAYHPARPDSILLIDTTGELAAWQTLADVVVIGKSFRGGGGQNPAEAAAAAKPIVTGPRMDNFTGLMGLLSQAEAVRQVDEDGSLAETLSQLLSDPVGAEAMGQRAARALTSHRGATGRTIDALFQHPAGREWRLANGRAL